MSKIYTRSFRVRFSETNANGWVGPADYLRYLVETAYDWGEGGGFGAQDSKNLGIAWVIRETEFNFFYPLRHNDVFDFTIWMVEWKRVRGYRAFELRLKENGLAVAQGIQQLVSLDRQTLRPTVPPDVIMDNYRLEQPRTFSGSFASEIADRFPDPSQTLQLHRAYRKVEWRDIDILNHVNNAIYAAFIEHASVQALAEAGWPPQRLKEENLAQMLRRLYLKYHAPALWGETLETTSQQLEIKESGGLQRVEIRRPTDEVLILESFIEWQLCNPENLQPVSIPESLARRLRVD